MFEKLYSCLLRLYPSPFRNAHGEESLQLIRDRARDERGFFPSLRLAGDLLVDWMLSVSRDYRRSPAALAAPSMQRPLDGTPSFQILEGESPRAAALISGGALSCLAVVALSLFVNHARSDRPLNFLSFMNASGVPAAQAQSQEATGTTARPVVEKPDFDAERHRVIAAAVDDLKRYYAYPETAQKVADALAAHEKNGDYNSVNDGATLAELLTRQIQEVSQDKHLTVDYSENVLPDHPQGPTAKDIARYRKAMQQNNCTFEKVETLPHQIGYLKLNSFPDLSICQSTAVAAMASLNHANALIIDLRDNGGGFPEMVSFLAAYLFDHPEYMYNPRESPSVQSWTRSPVAGSRLADKPVYVLTSATTFSGAEQFSYNLKMLKRATLVGETTRGGAHAGVWHRIDDHFGMGIPQVQAVNPFANADWEGGGVAPDVRVKAADALNTAEQLAQRKLRK